MPNWPGYRAMGTFGTNDGCVGRAASRGFPGGGERAGCGVAKHWNVGICISPVRTGDEDMVPQLRESPQAILLGAGWAGEIFTHKHAHTRHTHTHGL